MNNLDNIAQIAYLESQKRNVGGWTFIYFILILLTLFSVIGPILLLIIGGIHTSSNSNHNSKLDDAIRQMTPKSATGDKTIYF